MTWQVASYRSRVDQSHGISAFWLRASHEPSGDRVDGRIMMNYDVSEDYGREGWGLPVDVQVNRVWYLQRIKPRVSKVKGGTTSLLKKLIALADKCGAWVLAEVKAERGNDDDVIRLLSRAGFRAIDPAYPGLMNRAPGTSDTLLR